MAKAASHVKVPIGGSLGIRTPQPSACNGAQAATDPKAIRVARWLPGPAELIWPWLTDAGLLRTWLPELTVEPRLGGKLHLTRAPAARRGGEPSAADGVVTRFDPPRFLTCAWIERGHARATNDCDIACELALALHACEDRTLLVLTHRRLPVTEVPQLGQIVSASA